jgi:type II secretory pathway component PulF
MFFKKKNTSVSNSQVDNLNPLVNQVVKSDYTASNQNLNLNYNMDTSNQSVFTTIEQLDAKQPFQNQVPGRTKVKRGSSKVNKAKKTFLDNLSLLVGSGMGVNTSLRILYKNTQDTSLKKSLNSMLSSVESGSSLSQTMHDHNFLPDFLISLIRIGEESGNLADKIKRTVISLDKDQRRIAQLRSALFYPVFVLTLVIVLGLVVSTFILPRIGQVFSNMNVKLPVMTKILIQMGEFMSKYWYIVIPLTLAILILSMLLLFVFPLTKKSGQWLLFHLPIFNDLIVKTEVSRFSYNLAMLLNSGIPITKALLSLSKIHDYYMYKNYTEFLANYIQSGKSFHNIFDLNKKKTNSIFPFTAQEIITAGEESGKLPEVLEQLGERYEQESEQIAKNIAVLLEPALLIVVWIGVVFLAVAILLPIYSLVGNFQA